MATIDFYTTVIDNYGDAGFSFNLAISLLYYHPDLKIRYFCDDEKLFLNLKWNLDIKNIEYFDLKEIKKLTPSSLIYNFFDRKIDFEYLHTFWENIKLINFSYFLMHMWVGSLHDTKYQSKNVCVTHYIPSLLPKSWGVIINPYVQEFKKYTDIKGIWEVRKEFFPQLSPEHYNKKWISVFCYKETFEEIKNEFVQHPDILFFVFDNSFEWENIVNMPFLNIFEYYKFLYLCDKNIVRWENSLVESILSGKELLWDIYKENNGAHKEKIHDFSTYLRNNFSDKIHTYIDIFCWINLSEEKWKFFSDFITIEANFWGKYLENKINLENNLIKNLEKLT